MPLVDRALFLSDDASPDVVGPLHSERFTRFVVGGRPMLPTVERLARAVVDRGLEALLLTDLSAGEPSPDGGLLRAVLRLRKAGATLTNCGQVTTILATHRLRTALLLVNVDPKDWSSLPSGETAADLELLLSYTRR